MLGCSTAVTSGLLDLVWVAAWGRDKGKVRELWEQRMLLGRRGGKCGSKAESRGVKTTVLCQELECQNDRTYAATNSCGLSVV